MSPIFDFECQRCGKLFEYNLNEKDDYPRCPICSNKKCEKVFIKAPSHTIKGGHKTHYHEWGPYEYRQHKK